MMKQMVIHNTQLMHPIMFQIEKLYTSISADEPDPKGLFGSVAYDESFKPLFNVLVNNIYYVEHPKYRDFSKMYHKVEGIPSSKKKIICTSGGKDSLAVVLDYIEKGYDIYLYHMKGINKVYSDEFMAVQRIADRLSLPLYIDEVVLSGYQSFKEHPMKNMIIANGALSYGLREGISTDIVFGNYKHSTLNDNPFDVCAGDCIEMWYMYINIIQKYITGFNLELPLDNIFDAYDIMSNHIELLQDTVSCMSPYRFREHWRDRTMAKYKINLWENRCGCCWKCAFEYIYLADRNLLELHRAYYIHCIETLSNTLYKETGERAGDVKTVYKHYFDKDISESIMGEELKDATIRATRVVH